MAISTKITSVTTNTDGINIRFDNGVAMFFPDVAAIEQNSAQMETQEALATMILAWWLKRSPEATAGAIIAGKTFVMDFSANQVFKVVE